MVAPTGQVENLPFGSFSFFLSWLLGMIIGGAVTTEFLNKSVLLISVDLLPCTAAYKLCPYHLLSAALDKVTDTFSNPSFLPLTIWIIPSIFSQWCLLILHTNCGLEVIPTLSPPWATIAQCLRGPQALIGSKMLNKHSPQMVPNKGRELEREREREGQTKRKKTRFQGILQTLGSRHTRSSEFIAEFSLVKSRNPFF